MSEFERILVFLTLVLKNNLGVDTRAPSLCLLLRGKGYLLVLWKRNVWQSAV